MLGQELIQFHWRILLTIDRHSSNIFGSISIFCQVIIPSNPMDWRYRANKFATFSFFCQISGSGAGSCDASPRWTIQFRIADCGLKKSTVRNHQSAIEKHPRRKAVLYASDPAYLDAVLAEEKG
jgi:hypothetical protein